MQRLETIQKIISDGVVAVIRAESKEQGIKTVEAIKAGGIRALEITMTVPGALAIIAELSSRFKDEDVLIGAGTVLDPETARACILAGARYIVSPSLNPETIKLCNRYRVAVMPGVMTVKEAVEAMELGAEVLKLFPGSAFGPSFVSALKGPLPQANIMPTGGVSLENASLWIKAGAVALGIGGELTIGAKTGNYQQVTETARQFMDLVKQTRKEVSLSYL